MAGARSRYDDDLGEMRLKGLPEGLFLAGRAAGPCTLAEEWEQGERAGAAAAGDGAASAPEQPRVARSSTMIAAPEAGKDKRFVCFCEDVTDIDIDTAIAEGYDRIELLKRYSTVGMGETRDFDDTEELFFYKSLWPTVT